MSPPVSPNDHPARPGPLVREEAEALLPWLVTGRLSAAERQAVEATLAAHPELRDQLDMVAEDASATRAANEALGAPSAGALERLMRQIEREDVVRPAGLAGLGAAFSAWLDGLRERALLAPLAAAAMLLIAAQTVLLAGLLIEAPGDGYQTASGSGPAQMGEAFALVGFVPGATLSQVEAVLAEAGATLADGPRAGGIYALRLREAGLSSDERTRRLAILRARPEVVRFVAPAAP